MPPQQLPAPARRLLEIAKLRNRLRQSIRRGSLVCRDYSDPQLSYPYLALRLSDQLSDYELVHIDEMDRNLSRVLFKSRLRGRSVKYSSEVLVNPSSAVIIVPGADPWRAQAQSLLVLDRWHRNISRSRFVNLLSKVLINNPTSWSRSVKRSSAELVDPLFGLVCVQSLSVNPQFIAFNWSFRSRSVEVTSTALVNQPSTVDSVCVGRSPAITIQNSTLLEELQLVKKSKKNKPAGGSVARELDERRRSPFDVIPKLMNGAELYRDLERHQQSRRECVAVIETCAEYAQIISTGNQYIFNAQSKYSPAESSDCKIFAKLFEKFLDNLMDMVVLLPVSKTGKAKAKKGDDVKFGDYFPRSEDYMVSGVEWNYKKLCSVTTVEFHDCSKQVLEMESQIQDKSRKLPSQVAGIFFDITKKLQHFKDLGVGGEVAKVGLDMKNLIACTCFLLEQKLVKAWLVDKYAEALRCQKLLVGGGCILIF